ncbi:MAG: pyridoxal-dependent decarboxylase, exosortase A system-associated [Pontixanthobacter sp.]
MKPLGPIPQGYDAIDGQLSVGRKTASELIDMGEGTPLFVYSRAHLDRRAARLRTAMPDDLRINYAIKANPYAPLLKHMTGLVDGFDIASGGELEAALAEGIPPDTISFAGPGKRDAELTAAIREGVTINLESENEAERALAIGDVVGHRPRLAVRVNPAFELRGSGMKMGGGAKPFGVDEDRVPALIRKLIAAGAEWRGLHIFAGSQALDPEALIETQANTLELAERLANSVGEACPKLNMGGGFGIPYFNGDEPLDIEAIGSALKERFKNLPDPLRNTEICIELGRYLVGEAGVYLTTIVDRKISHDTVYLICDGGLHHQLAASGNFGTVVRRNYPLAIATQFDAEPTEIVNVVGCLCTPLDRLADGAHLPRAEVGDVVAVFCAGAYGATASPSGFLGQGPAEELLI